GPQDVRSDRPPRAAVAPRALRTDCRSRVESRCVSSAARSGSGAAQEPARARARETGASKMKATSHIPEGFRTVTPYLVVQHVDRLLTFLKQAFGATELMRMPRPDGTVGHA